jgi:signal transduction histidine kinase/ActR/RegA family two-component response regulator
MSYLLRVYSMLFRTYALIVFLLCWPIASHANNSLLIDADFQHTALGQYLSYYCDNTNQQSFAQIQQQQFKPLNKDEVSFGFRQPICWFKFSIQNQKPVPITLILSSNYSGFDKIDIFSAHSPYNLLTSIGDNSNYNQRDLKLRILATTINIPVRSESAFYIRAQTSGSFYLPLTISTYHDFLNHRQFYDNLVNVSYGVVIGLFLYHLFLFFLTKEKVQFFYILYIFCTLLFFAAQQGSLFQFWPNASSWNNLSVYTFSFLALSSGTLFSRLFLNTKNSFKVHKSLKYLALFLAIFSVIHPLFPTSLVAFVNSTMGLFIITYLFMIAIKRYYDGFVEAKLFITAWGLLLVIGAAMILMMQLGAGKISEMVLAAQLAFAAQQILLSIGLAQRINSLKREKEQREQEALIALAENKAKTDFLARMSHEIRTPMNAVLGVSQLLEATPLSTSQQQYINLLKNSGQLLLSIISDVLDYSKINSGNIELERTTFNLPRLMTATHQILSTNLQQKNIDLIIDIDPNLPLWIEGDPTRLQQVLFNLLSNAIKFTHQGSVRLQAKQVFQIDAQHVQLQITIKDTGIGLNKNQISHLFSAFHQADASTTRKYGGTGLGLAISKQLIELMQGSITVSSQMGKGSTFTILLPVKLGKEKPNVTSPLLPIIPQMDFSKLRILLTEDNAVNQLIISALIKQLGIDIQIAHNGEEAFTIISQQHAQFDVILMNCEMPILDGLTATKRIRTWEKSLKLTPIPIIALTAHALPEYQQRCLEAGMNDYLTKPLLLEQLVNKLLTLKNNELIL